MNKTTSDIVFFTGAGVSADSGLETYRDENTGLWENIDPLVMASIDAWEADPEPMFAAQAGAEIWEVSTQPTELTRLASRFIEAPAEIGVPQALAEIAASSSGA